MASREIKKGMKILADLSGSLEALPTSTPNIYPLLAYFAWAIDFDQSYLSVVGKALSRFRSEPIELMSYGEFDLPQHHRRALQPSSGEIRRGGRPVEEGEKRCGAARQYRADNDHALLLGRCHWKKFNYNKALKYVRKAKRYDLGSKLIRRAAAIELLEAWLLFLMGDIKAAINLLEHAKSELDNEDTRTDYANAISFEGRLARAQGDNDGALKCFLKAVGEYEKGDPSHSNIARTYIAISFLYRLKACELDEKRDQGNIRKRHSQEVDRLRALAFEQLEKASEIYSLNSQGPSQGIGEVHNHCALLYFDASKFAQAEEEVRKAYIIGCKLNNHFIIADAKRLQSEMALEVDDNAIKARELAEEAVAHAVKTDNRRLQARTWIRLGLTLLEQPFNDYDGAQRAYETAERCLVAEDKDYIRQSLNKLKNQMNSFSTASNS